MRLNVRVALERSDFVSETPDFVLVEFASAAESEVVLAQRPAASYQLAEVAYEVVAPVAASPSSTALAA